MKMAKSYKIILLTITLILSVLASLMLMPMNSNSYAATSSTTPSSYFRGTELTYADDNVKATAKKDGTFEFINTVVADELCVNFKVGGNVKDVTISFKVSAYYQNDSMMTKSVKIDFENGKVSYGNAEKTNTLSRDVFFSTKVVANELLVKVNDIDFFGSDDSSLVRNEGLTSIEDVTFKFGMDEDISDTFELISVDQKTSDATGAYKQVFVQEGNYVKTVAKPRASLNESMYTKSNAINIIDGKQYSVSITSYSLFGVSDKNSMGIELAKGATSETQLWTANTTNPKSFAVRLKDGVDSDTITLKIVSTDATYNTVEEFSVNVYREITEVPTYNLDEKARENFEEALLNATKEKYDDNEEETYIRLGDYISIPSMKDLLNETIIPYSQLTYTIYYLTPSSSLSTTSTMQIYIDRAGDYSFFVIFSDSFGNALTTDDFYTTGEDDANEVIPATYYDYIFSFHIEDDAPLSISAPSSQGEAFVGTTYEAKDFEIEAYNYSTTYKLYYNEDVNATEDSENWHEVIKSASITDSYSNDYFTKDQVTAIAYDGETGFTPNAKGAYKIVCSVTSTHTSRTASANSIIKVENETIEKKSDSDWAKNNVWSIVFLSVGTLCLIGILVLLFIKPKEKTEVKKSTAKTNKKA